MALRFEGGTCVCPDEAWPLLEKHGVYTGVGQPKLVWRADTEDRPEAGSSSLDDVAVVSGMQTNARRGPKEPLRGWDKLTVGDLSKRIKAGEVIDLSGAVAYEAANRKRRGVLRALADAIGSTDEAEAVEADVVPDTFSAEVPTDK